MTKENFYVVTHEPGFHAPKLPTWTGVPSTLSIFDKEYNQKLIKRKEVEQVPGAFQLLNVLSPLEAKKLIDISELLGYDQDSPVSLPHEVRHNENFNWVVSEYIDKTIWERCKHLVIEQWQGQSAKGINAKFRFYKYKKGDFFIRIQTTLGPEAELEIKN